MLSSISIIFFEWISTILLAILAFLLMYKESLTNFKKPLKSLAFHNDNTFVSINLIKNALMYQLEMSVLKTPPIFVLVSAETYFSQEL